MNIRIGALAVALGAGGVLLAVPVVSSADPGEVTGTGVAASSTESTSTPAPKHRGATRRDSADHAGPVRPASAAVTPPATAPVAGVAQRRRPSAVTADLASPTIAPVADRTPVGGAIDPLMPIVTPVSWAALAVSRREHTDTPATATPAASVTTAAPAAGTGPQPAPPGPAAAAVSPANPVATVVGQIRAVVSEFVNAVTQVIAAVVQKVTAVINRIMTVFSPRGDSVDVADMQLTTLQYKDIAEVDPNKLAVDVYTDPDFSDRPVMIFIHGGGLKNGDKRNDGAYLAKAPHFVSTAYVYVSVNYRLSPGVVSPSHIEDVADAVMFVHDNIADYGGDPNQIFVMGHSAGAYLATLLATNEKYIEGAGGDLSMIKGVVSLDVWAYMSVADWQQGVLSSDPAERFDAVPANHVDSDKGIPPFLIFYRDGSSQESVTRDQTAFSDLLLANGVPAASVLGVNDDHIELNREVGTVGDEKTAIIMEFLADPTRVASIAAGYGFTAT